MTPLSLFDIQKYILACTSKAGVSVMWHNGSPQTDGKIVKLPYMSSAMTDDEVVQLKQWVKHETSHIVHSDWTLLEERKPAKMLMFLLNLIEDHRVDWLNDREYAGDKLLTEAAWMAFEKRTKKLHATNPPDKYMTAIMAPLFSWDMDVRDDLWLRTGDPFTPAMCADGKKVYDKLHAGNYADEVRAIRNITHPRTSIERTWDLAVRILKEVFDADPEVLKNKEEEEAAGKGEGEKGDKGVGEGGGSGEGDGKGEGEGELPLQDIDFGGKQALPHSLHNGGSGVNATNYTCGKGGYKPDPKADVSVRDFVTGEKLNFPYSSYPHDSKFPSQVLEKCAGSGALANNIRTQLQIMSRDRWEYGKKRGKLNNASLYRVGLKEAKGLNERLFKQQISNDTLDVCVSVLVDASGSMGGTKFINASAAAIVLNNVLAHTLHIPLQIEAFSDGAHSIMFVLKHFDKPRSPEQLANDFASVSGHLWDNVDGEAIAWAYDRIKHRREKRKLLVVLSDGSPAGGYSRGDISAYTRTVIREVEKSPVELIGVGIMHRAVSDWYTKSVCIDRASDIEEGLLSLISKYIIRSV